ncbi:CBS domain-containing protein [Streptomyces spongiicola]|uniref:CBS domain-containing protein n=1 Tax=Streptomyces spongiicola TaxID=1690221 RepID=A0A388SWV3_9ACTN|nr:CBS domain-containing protein [Streptomyces spongiicola]
MTSTVVAVAPHARFKEVVAAMGRWRVSAVPVVDDGGRVVGVVSEADLLRREELRGADPAPVDQQRPGSAAGDRVLRAGDLMTAPPITVRAAATLPHAARLMARHRVKRLPVVDGRGVLRGVVSRADLLKVFLRPDEDIAADVQGLVDRLFAGSLRGVRVAVDDGVVTLGGTLGEGDLASVVGRLAQVVEGVVEVRCEFAGPPASRTDPASRADSESSADPQTPAAPESRADGADSS